MTGFPLPAEVISIFLDGVSPNSFGVKEGEVEALESAAHESVVAVFTLSYFGRRHCVDHEASAEGHRSPGRNFLFDR